MPKYEFVEATKAIPASARRGGGTSKVDLAPYIDRIKELVQRGKASCIEIVLDEGDNAGSLKRHFRNAQEAMGIEGSTFDLHFVGLYPHGRRAVGEDGDVERIQPTKLFVTFTENTGEPEDPKVVAIRAAKAEKRKARKARNAKLVAEAAQLMAKQRALSAGDGNGSSSTTPELATSGTHDSGMKYATTGAAPQAGAMAKRAKGQRDAATMKQAEGTMFEGLGPMTEDGEEGEDAFISDDDAADLAALAEVDV